MQSVLILAAAFASASVAVAQEAPSGTPAAPPPDKSGFTLFDPTPAADLRPLCTDRPTKSTSPCTVDAGRVQFETDVFNVTVDRAAGFTTTTWLATNPTIKLGLTNAVDVEFNIVPVEVVTVRDDSTGRTLRASGVGDFYTRLKWSLLGDDTGAIGFALVPWVKLPTANSSIGNRTVEAGLVAPVSLNLPMNFSLVIDPEVDALKNSDNGSHHLEASGLLSLSRPVSKTVTLSAEVWSAVDFEPAGRTTQISADLGAAWIPTTQPNLQFDGGVNLGLNSRTPGVQGYVGVSRRF